MDNSEFLARCSLRRAEASASPAETRARIELYNIKLSQLRDTHACLMPLPREQAGDICRRAVALDARDGRALRHTNALGFQFYKYLK